MVFVLWFERCSNGGFGRAVRDMESSFRMRNVDFSVFLTCILPRFMRNAIPLKDERYQITFSNRVTNAVKIVDSCIELYERKWSPVYCSTMIMVIVPSRRE